MRIGLIAPALDLNRENRGEPVFLLPPLTFPVLAALTPPGIEIEIIEERVRSIPYDDDFDLVGITFVTPFAPRAYEIADRFRERGVKVVLGGPHASVLPEEALSHADAVVAGEAEEIWGPVVDDVRNDSLQRIYRAPGLVDLKHFPRPRLDVIPEQFSYKNSTLASKGCQFRCDFCFTSSVNQHRQRIRPIHEVVRDIEAMEWNRVNGKYFVFWDDNLIGDPDYAKELFSAIAPLKRKWGAAVAANVAHVPELLRFMERSGCVALFIGMESINEHNLRESRKYHNRVHKYREMIKRLHDHGIAVTGAFVFGFDHDDISVFNRTLEFLVDIDIDCVTPAILTPLPGTELYDRMNGEGRIHDRDWAHYDYFHVVFEPRRMTREELYEGFLKFNRDFFSYRSIFTRLGRSRTQLTLVTLANLGYHNFYNRMISEYKRGIRGRTSLKPEEKLPQNRGTGLGIR